MTKHTPAPWETFDNGTDTIGIVHYAEDSPYNDGRDSVIICQFKEDGLIPTERAEQEANARLIAAAPELLEVCEYLMSVNSHWWQEANGADDMIRAAIAKAKGE